MIICTFEQMDTHRLQEYRSRIDAELKKRGEQGVDLQPYVGLINVGGDECGMGLAAEYPPGYEDEATIGRADDSEWYRKEDVDALLLGMVRR